MTNPNNAVGTNGAYNGRTSVEAFNDVMNMLSRGIISGWECVPNSGLTVSLGGNGTVRDVAAAQDAAGNKTSINNRSGSPINVTVAAAPASNTRIDAIVAYVESSPTGSSTVTDNPAPCGIIPVSGTPSNSPVAPTESAIRTAITADGASGTTAFYVVLAYITIASGTTDLTADNIAAGPYVQINAPSILPPNSVTASNIDFTTFSEIYDNEVTAVGKTYTISTPGIYLAWGISANPSNGSIPSVTITMRGAIKAKSVSVSTGVWATATAIAVGLVNSGDTIVVSQENANAADHRSSVGMCLIQRTQ